MVQIHTPRDWIRQNSRAAKTGGGDAAFSVAGSVLVLLISHSRWRQPAWPRHPYAYKLHSPNQLRCNHRTQRNLRHLTRVKYEEQRPFEVDIKTKEQSRHEKLSSELPNQTPRGLTSRILPSSAIPPAFQAAAFYLPAAIRWSAHTGQAAHGDYPKPSHNHSIRKSKYLFLRPMHEIQGLQLVMLHPTYL